MRILVPDTTAPMAFPAKPKTSNELRTWFDSVWTTIATELTR